MKYAVSRHDRMPWKDYPQPPKTDNGRHNWVALVACSMLWSWTAEIRGRLAAHLDIARGHYELLRCGLPPPWRPEYARLLHERYDIEFRPVAGCIVSHRSFVLFLWIHIPARAREENSRAPAADLLVSLSREIPDPEPGTGKPSQGRHQHRAPLAGSFEDRRHVQGNSVDPFQGAIQGIARLT